jgi:hypothetical protein
MEAVAAGVDRSTLARLCESGLLERLERLIGVDDELEHLQTLYDHLVAENNALRDDMAE